MADAVTTSQVTWFGWQGDVGGGGGGQEYDGDGEGENRVFTITYRDHTMVDLCPSVHWTRQSWPLQEGSIERPKARRTP